MGKTILITSGKGGVGKSTVCVALAINLACRGKHVVLADADVGLRCADLMLRMQDRVVYDMGDYLEGKAGLNQVLVTHPDYRTLQLMAAPQLMSASDIKKKEMRSLINLLKEQNDFVLIDCPAGIGRNARNAFFCADEAILVCTPDSISLRDGERVLQIIREEMQMYPSLIINKADAVLMKKGLTDLPEEIAAALGLPLLGVLPFSMAVQRGTVTNTTAADCPDQKVRTEAENIARRMLGENIPLPGYRLSFFARRRKKL